MSVKHDTTAYIMLKSYREMISKNMRDFMKVNGYETIASLHRAYCDMYPDDDLPLMTFGRWINGESLPDLYYLSHLAKFMDMDIYELVYGKPVHVRSREGD